MPKYRFVTQEHYWKVYKMDIPEGVTDIEQYFYANNSDKNMIDSECYYYELESVNKINPEDLDNGYF